MSNCDDVFEGDDTSQDRNEIAQDLDLFSLSNKYKKLWKLPECPSHHRAVLLLIAKGIPHDTFKRIRSKISEAIGNKPISASNFTMTDKKLKEWGLSNEKISGIRKILALPEVTSGALCKIKEGGIYLVKAFKIFQEEDDDIMLFEDYNVLKNLGILFFRNKPMTKTEAQQVCKNWINYRSQISYFLYRLKPDSADKIHDETKELDKYDFWGFDRPIDKYASSESSEE